MSTPIYLRPCVAALLASAAWAANEPVLISFEKQNLESHYWSEGAAFGDLDRDGHADAVYGPYWWKGPGFAERHEFRPPQQTFVARTPEGGEKVLPGYEGALGSRNAYSMDSFFSFIQDFNGDGWNDVLTIAFPGTAAYVLLNPAGQDRPWPRHAVLESVDNESPTFVDLTGDGKPELVCVHRGDFGYATPDWDDPQAPWKFTPVSRNGQWGRFTHGLGVGDVNGDGRRDVLFSDGWFEQPDELAGGPVWRRHDFPFARAGAQLHAYDVNGDGRTDVVTALSAHYFGLAWHEQLAESDENGSPRFRTHIIMNEQAMENRYGVAFSELHAVELVDVDGDGLKDIVTGKCFWSHGPDGSPDGNQPAVLYWFRLHRGPAGAVEWVPHQIDDDSGVGRQIGLGDIDGDGRPDLIVGNKKGAAIFRNRARQVSQRTWELAQPDPIDVSGRIRVQDRVLAPASPRDAGMSAASLAALVDAYRQEIEGEQLYPFAGYLIARHGKIVAHEAIGRAHHATGEPLRTDALFPLASVTKAITATALMILWDEGRVALDEPVRMRLPAFARLRLTNGEVSPTPLTLRHLLTHTAGFWGHFPAELMTEQEWGARGDWSLAAYVDRIAKQPLKFPPGSGEQYSSLNTDVIARLIEVVSGLEFSQFLQERLFTPLGMTQTSHYPGIKQWSRIARPHRYEDGRWVPAAEPMEFDHTFPHGGYGLYSTTGDLAVFVQMILNGGVYGGRRILSPRAVDRMLQVLSPVAHETTQGWAVVRGASWEVGETIRGVKPSDLPAFLAGRMRQPDEPQRFFGRTGFGGMFVFADRDADLVGIFATKGNGRPGTTGARDFLTRAVNAVAPPPPAVP